MSKIKSMLQNSRFKDFFLYVVVGGLATIVEWAAFWVLTNTSDMHYLWATALAFALSTLANWYFGRLLVFKERHGSLAREIGSIYLASMVGLLLNLIIMFVLVQTFAAEEMWSKVIATVLVFVYNYLVRRLVIYKKKN